MRRNDDLEITIVAKFTVMASLLDERARRLWAAAESVAIGYGGDALVSAATGTARETLPRTGRRELVTGVAPTARIRRAGAGRPSIGDTQPGVKAALEALVEPLTRGDPMSPLRWTCKSRAKLTAALTTQGWDVSSTTVGRLLHALGYRLQAVRKSREGTSHPDRNAQFEHINATAAAFLRRRQPVISVDTKKKELVGDFKNARQEWQPTGTPEAVLVHDFPGDAIGKAIPYGVYDMARNEAWVSVGRDHDTPAFAVASIRQSWTMMGRRAYPRARDCRSPESHPPTAERSRHAVDASADDAITNMIALNRRGKRTRGQRRADGPHGIVAQGPGGPRSVRRRGVRSGDVNHRLQGTRPRALPSAAARGAAWARPSPRRDAFAPHDSS